MEIARLYQAGGAAAMSVLTEPEHFKGSLDDLRRVAAAVSCRCCAKTSPWTVTRCMKRRSLAPKPCWSSSPD